MTGSECLSESVKLSKGSDKKLFFDWDEVEDQLSSSYFVSFQTFSLFDQDKLFLSLQK